MWPLRRRPKVVSVSSGSSSEATFGKVYSKNETDQDSGYIESDLMQTVDVSTVYEVVYCLMTQLRLKLEKVCMMAFADFIEVTIE